MTTQAIYRRYRPNSFADVNGQEHVTQTLKNAVRLNRVAKAYLLCGPRGSGKTTTARILAKAANCTQTNDGDACNNCSNCAAISMEACPDVTEADAASYRGVDDVREILKSVPLAPVHTKKKFYIIDEVHMLTDASSNVLSNALENAPEHVNFILCTTDPERLPSQITSRCQQMQFRRIPIDTIADKLQKIAQQEGTPVGRKALETIAQDATGSLRDAEATLEKMLVTFPEGFTAEQVTLITGTGASQNAMNLIRHMAAGDTSQAVSAVKDAHWQSGDLKNFHGQTSLLMRALMHTQAGAGESVNLPEHVRNEVATLAKNHPEWPTSAAIRAWHSMDLRQDPDDPTPLETAAAAICQISAPPAKHQHTERTEPTTAPEPEPRRQQERKPFEPEIEPDPKPPTRQEPTMPQQPAPDERDQPSPYLEQWKLALRDLSHTKGVKYNIGALMRDCRTQNITLDDNLLTLPMKNPATLGRIQEELSHPESQHLLAEALKRHFGDEVEFELATEVQQPSAPDANNPQGSLLSNAI